MRKNGKHPEGVTTQTMYSSSCDMFIYTKHENDMLSLVFNYDGDVSLPK